MANKDTAKNWFARKAKPTQAQFWQLFEWLRFKEEPIAISDVDGLEDALQGNSSTPKEFIDFTLSDGTTARLTIDKANDGTLTTHLTQL